MNIKFVIPLQNQLKNFYKNKANLSMLNFYWNASLVLF